MDSGGKVLVAPIHYQATRPWRWESQDDLVPAGQTGGRTSSSRGDPTALGRDQRGGGATVDFGRPAHQYQVGQYVVMVYNYNLLTRLS